MTEKLTQPEGSKNGFADARGSMMGAIPGETASPAPILEGVVDATYIVRQFDNRPDPVRVPLPYEEGILPREGFRVVSPVIPEGNQPTGKGLPRPYEG